MRDTVPPSTGSGPIRRRASWTLVSGLVGMGRSTGHRRANASAPAPAGFRSFDVEGMRELGPPVNLPSHVDLVVATVGADPPRPEEPAPEAEPALLGELLVEHERPALHAEVAPQLLPDAVDEHRVGLPHSGGQAHPRLRHAVIIPSSPPTRLLVRGARPPRGAAVPHPPIGPGAARARERGRRRPGGGGAAAPGAGAPRLRGGAGAAAVDRAPSPRRGAGGGGDGPGAGHRAVSRGDAAASPGGRAYARAPPGRRAARSRGGPARGAGALVPAARARGDRPAAGRGGRAGGQP